MTFRTRKFYPDVRFIFDGQSLNNQPAETPYLTLPFVATSGLGPKGNVAIGGASWTALTTGTGIGGVSKSAPQRLHKVFRHSAAGLHSQIGGTSDLMFEGDSAATVLADQTSYTNAARAAAATYGMEYYCLASTIPPTFNMTTDQNDRRIAFNASLIDEAGGAVFDAVVDLTENELGPLADPDDTNLYFDGVHWSAAGVAYASTLIRPELIIGRDILLAALAA